MEALSLYPETNPTEPGEYIAIVAGSWVSFIIPEKNASIVTKDLCTPYINNTLQLIFYKLPTLEPKSKK